MSEERLDARLHRLSAAALHDLIPKISAIDECKGWWKGRDLPSPAVLERLKNRVVEISARASTRIDGRSPARPAGRRIKSAEDGEAQRVADYAEVLRAVVDGYREMAFGQDLILQLHARLLRRSARDQWHRGKYKASADEAVAGPRASRESVALRPSDPRLTPRDMAAAIEWTASRLASGRFHPLLVIAGFVLEFLAIRPFADGNGRLSRILTNLLLLQCGYAYTAYASLEQVITERRTEYYLALRASQAKRNLPTPDISVWLHAFLDALRAQSEQLKPVAEGRPERRLLSQNQLRVLALFDRTPEVTNRLVRTELGLPKETVKQVLNRLLALALVRRVGAGRAIRYRQAPAAANEPDSTPPSA